VAHPKCVELRDRWYVQRGWKHAYRHHLDAVTASLDHNKSILDLGCGRTFPLATKYLAHTDAVFGLDPVAEPSEVPHPAVVRRGSAVSIPFADDSFDVVTSRSVLEHLAQPQQVFHDIARVLKPAGRFIFLTPSRYDYVSVASMLMPNVWHPWLVKQLEGRPDEDTFPTFYRANTRARAHRLAHRAGLYVERLDYLNHHPVYFMFSPCLYRLATLYDQLVSRLACLGFLRGWLLGILRKPER